MTKQLDSTRREFLRTLLASAGSAAVAACGTGGGGSDSVGTGIPPDTGTVSGLGTNTETSTGASAGAGSDAAAGAGTNSGSSTTSARTINWQVAPNQTLVLQPGTTTTIATGAQGLYAEVSPDLPPGRTLTVTSGGDVNIVSAAGAPVVDIQRNWIIELLDSELATAQNMRTGQIYGYTQTGARRNIQFAMVEARDGDVIQISPGAIWSPGVNDGSSYLEGGGLHIYKSVSVTNIPGHGRWRLAPRDVPYVDGMSGIIIREPNQCYSDSGDNSTANPRKTILVEGFDFSNWGRNGDDLGVKIRSNGGAKTWDGYHSSVTFRNFKVGKLPFHESASGIGGAAENLLFENGHVYDTGGGKGAADGQDHNFYVSARNLTFRGVRGSRSRGSATTDMDGHIFKTAAVNMKMEGCVIDCGPEGDNSFNIQCRAGGNVVIRGCLLIGGIKTQNQGTGLIVYENESIQTPWYFGQEGHTLLVERNVFINHYGRPLVFFRPSISANYMPPSSINSVTVRDNIGMVASTPTSSPGWGEPMWILNNPKDGATWSTLNTVMPYGTDEPGFNDRAILRYTRTAGPVAASGNVATSRFVFPHGFESRNDAFGGLG